MLNTKQKEFFDMAAQGKNLFITGSAGVGKSYLVNSIIEDFRKKGKTVVVCATTGIAAINIGGFTVHNQFHIDVNTIKPRKENINTWIEDVDLIVIDEISMMSFLLFNVIGKEINKYNKNCQIIVIGDFFQLPPIVGDNEKRILFNRGYSDTGSYYCYHSEYWKSFNFKVCVLTETMRQEDQNFSTALFNLSRGKLTKEDNKYLAKAQNKSFINDKDAIIIACTNKVVSQINEEKLKEIKEKEIIYKAKTQGTYEKDIQKEIKLKVGAKVMMIINSVEDNYVNGDIGYITEVFPDSVEVELVNGNVILVDPYEFGSFIYEDGKIKKIGSITQLPLKLAWAITVHKSQGQTFDKVNFLYDKGFFIGARENLTLLYVGLSRVKSIDNLYLRIIMAVPPFVSQEILDFYNNKYETYISAYSTRTYGFGFES